MVLSYHGLFKLKEQNQELMLAYAKHYNHVYHFAYKIITQQNIQLFQSHFIRLFQNKEINYNLLVQDYLNNKIKLPKHYFDLNSDNKKTLLNNKSITARQLNSIRFQLKGNLSSLYTLTLDHIEKKKLKIKSLKEQLVLIKKKIQFQQDVFKLNHTDIQNIKIAYPYYVKSIINKKKFDITNYLNNNQNNKDLIHIKDNEKNILIKTEKELNQSTNFKIQTNHQNIKTSSNAYEKLLPLLHKKLNLEKRIKKLNQELNKTIKTLLQGKLPLCFGTKKLFNQQFNLQHYHQNYIPKVNKKGNFNPKNNHEFYFNLWKKQWIETRNSSFYLVGAKAETAGNQSCIGLIQKNGLITLKIRLPDEIINKFKDSNKILNFNHQDKKENRINKTADVHLNFVEKENNKYLILTDLDFGYAHDKLVSALKANLTYKDSKDQNRYAIHYRFEKNNNDHSPKYNHWKITFQLEEKSIRIITNKNCGAIGIDLNQEHISVTEINHHGNLVKSFDIPMKLSQIYNKNNNIYQSKTHRSHGNPGMRHHNKITDLTSNQSKNLIEHIVKEICDLAEKTAKPIVVEKLDFQYKKQTLSLENKNNAFNKKRNKQLSLFVYSKFKEALLSRAERQGIEIIQINPAYTSLLGLIKYQKKKGISSHQAASFVIARKGLGFKERIPYIIEDKVKSNFKSHETSNKEKDLSKKVVQFIYRGCVIESPVPARNQNFSRSDDIALLKDFSKSIALSKKQVNEKLKQAQILDVHKNQKFDSQHYDKFMMTVGERPEFDA